MALLWQCPSPLFSSLQLSKLFTINPKRSISNTHISKSFRISFPSLTHQPICCSNFSSESESYSSSSTGVFIKGLPRSTAEGRLMKVFWQFGEVKQVNVVGERVSKQCLGSAFVWFDKEESALLAVKEMNGKVAYLAIILILVEQYLHIPFSRLPNWLVF